MKRLKIRWRVIIEPGQGDTLLIMSEFTNVARKIGEHRISAPQQYLANPEYFRLDWAHELCHAVLAERIDLIFGGSAVVGEIDSKERERRAKTLYYARIHEDLLVNDARDELLGRDLTVKDVYSTHQHFLELTKMAKTGHPKAIQFFQEPRLPWILALNIAEDERHNCGVGAIEVLDLYESNSRQKIKAICSIYQDLPRLSWKREKDLPALERSIQKIVAEIFRENWKPKMVNHPKFPLRKVWSVE
ncbi:MAG: hypothetical protein AB1465_05870 [Patescibacteria group bacterium]